MKKIVLIFVVFLSLSTIFVSCNKSNSSSDSDKVVLKIANYALLEAGYEEFWKQVETDFEDQNPNIDIQWITAPYGEIVNQVINMAGGGDKVDGIFADNVWIAGFKDAGLAAPLEDILPPAFIDDFYPEVMEFFEEDGLTYGVPLYISPFVLYYNKNLFEQAGLDINAPPTTYEEMLVMADKLSKLKDKNGNRVYAFGQTTASVPVSGSSINGMIFNFGGEVFNANGNFSIDNQGFQDGIEMLKLLDDRGYNPQNAKLKDLRNLFALEQLAMYYDQSWGLNGVQSINPDAKNFMASAAPLRGGLGNGQSLLQAHCFILVDNGEARRNALSEFIQYIISEPVLADYLADITPAFPVKRSMSNIEPNPILAGVGNAAQNIRSQPFLPQLSDLNLELCYLAQAVTLGDQDVSVAIKNFKEAVLFKLSE